MCRRVSPGGTNTAILEAASIDLRRLPRMARATILGPADVVEAALAGLGRRRSVVVGWGNALTTFSGRLMPGA
jgi:hypothetical protein